MSAGPLRPLAGLALFALAALWAAGASGTPPTGATLPAVSLVDGWDRTTSLSSFRGLPVLVVYEDKGSATLNRALKAELARLAAGDRYRAAVALVAVADVGGYDYWPVRGFVKEAIRKESLKQGTTIYCDWDGHVRRGLAVDAGTSNVVLYGKDGAVIFADRGALSDARRSELLGLLARQVEGSLPSHEP